MLFWNRGKTPGQNQIFQDNANNSRIIPGCPGLLIKIQVNQDLYEPFVYLIVPKIVITTRMCVYYKQS